jgi:hypothetical protein
MVSRAIVATTATSASPAGASISTVAGSGADRIAEAKTSSLTRTQPSAGHLLVPLE